MTPRQKGKKKTARSSDGDNEEGIVPKRLCTTSTRATTSTTTTVSVKQEEEELDVAGGSNISNNPLVAQAALPDSVTSTTETNNAATTTTTTTDDDDDVDNNELPTPVELSKMLCRVVDTDHYSRAEACRALDKLYQWAHTEDPEYLKYFHIHGGIIKVIDFLKATMNDSSCVGIVRMECIENAGRVIGHVSYLGADNCNIEIVTKIVTSAIDYNGINTLLSASDEYSGGDDVPRLQALKRVWFAMRNISSFKDIVINQDQAIIVFKAGIDILSQLKLYDGPIVSSILRVVFDTLYNIIDNSYMGRKNFQNKNVFSKCLDVFRKDGIWGDRNEKITDASIDFLYHCRCRKLLKDSDDYEIILPILAVGLKKFGLNPDSNKILRKAVMLIHKACDSIQNKKIIERSGVMESLSVLLASNDIEEDQKEEVREVIVRIVHRKNRSFPISNSTSTA